MARVDWRSVAATWGGAAMLLMQQFGVPTSGAAMRETRIVRVVTAARLEGAAERMPDGTILTLPLELGSGQRQDPHQPASRFTDN